MSKFKKGDLVYPVRGYYENVIHKIIDANSGSFIMEYIPYGREKWNLSIKYLEAHQNFELLRDINDLKLLLNIKV